MYTITITKTEKVTKKVNEYQRLRNEYEDEKGHFNSRADREQDPQYGYVTTEKEQEEKTTILVQEVEEIDLKKVIAAVNGI